MTAPALPSSLLLFRCPPLSAWMLKRQCETNQGKAKAAASGPKNTIKAIGEESIAALGLEPCIRCPGVEALVKKGGSQPRPASDLRTLSTPDPAFVRFNRFVEPSRRASAPRIGSSIKQSQAQKERRLGPREEETMPKATKKPQGEKYRHLYQYGEQPIFNSRRIDGKEHRVSLGTHDWDEAARKRDAYEKEHGIAGAAAIPKRETPSRASAPNAPARDALAQPIEKVAGPPQRRPVDVAGLLEDLKSRRAAVVAQLAQLDEAITSIERAQEILGRPAA